MKTRQQIRRRKIERRVDDAMHTVRIAIVDGATNRFLLRSIDRAVRALVRLNTILLTEKSR